MYTALCEAAPCPHGCNTTVRQGDRPICRGGQGKHAKGRICSVPLMYLRRLQGKWLTQSLSDGSGSVANSSVKSQAS